MGLIRANNAPQGRPVVPQKAAQALASRQNNDTASNEGTESAPQVYPAAEDVFLALTTLQHRGQDAAGIASYAAAAEMDGVSGGSAGGFRIVKNLGLVDAVFTRENVARLDGKMAIGHTRYSTAGTGDLGEVQPMVISYPFGIALVHNGNIVNTEQLARELRQKSRRHLLTSSDTEIILNLFAEGLSDVPVGPAGPAENEDTLSFDQIVAAARAVFSRARGSYSIVAMIAGNGMVAFRDPDGIRPLMLGRRLSAESATAYDWMLASESATLSFLGFEIVRDVAPGEVIWIQADGTLHSRTYEKPEPHPCMFEWVYFASPESIIEGANVYAVRIGLGKTLAETISKEITSGRIRPDIVVPVPETARIAAIALAEKLKLPYREVLIKNRYVQRSFILDSQAKRQRAVHLKLSPVRTEIAGKRVLLVDDSIVRGTTSKKIIDLVRKAGAKEVYFVSTCPPIRYPCFYGIDFPDKNELIANNRDRAAIEAELGADSVIYQSLEGLKSAIKAAAPEAVRGTLQNPCMACLDGCYPVAQKGEHG